MKNKTTEKDFKRIYLDVLGIKSMQADQDLKDMRGWGTFYCSAKWSLDKKIKNWLAFVLSQKKSKIKQGGMSS